MKSIDNYNDYGSFAAARIAAGELPRCLEGNDWELYANAQLFTPGHEGADAWDAFCQSVGGIMWVRYQGYERDYDAEDAARDWGDA